MPERLQQELQQLAVKMACRLMQLAALLIDYVAEWRYMQSDRRLRGALHARHPLGVMMDAPSDVIWDVMRAWVADHPVKKQVTRCKC